MNIEAIDLFCGAGGLTHGLERAGIKVKLGVDIDAACEYAYVQNNKAKFLKESVTDVSSKEIQNYFSKTSLRLLAGCAPCQPFSTLSNGIERQKSDKWPLLNEFGRLVSELKPDYVTMENVPTLRTQEIFSSFQEALNKNGYFVTAQVVNAAHYGVPQRRHRLVLLASLKSEVRLLKPDALSIRVKTVREAIEMLPTLEGGKRDTDDLLHQAPLLGETNLRRIRASRPGGTWEDWPEDLRLACHKKQEGASFKSVYGRMEWDKPSPTITTQSFNYGTGRFGHPEQDRAISLREAAILQSFPRDYEFVSTEQQVPFATLGRLIGNAVPVELGYAIGMTIVRHAKAGAKNAAKKQPFKQ